jgi:hypothetical protein
MWVKEKGDVAGIRGFIAARAGELVSLQHNIKTHHARWQHF